MITDDQIEQINRNYDHFYESGKRVGRYWAFSDVYDCILQTIGAGTLPCAAGLNLYHAIQALQTGTEPTPEPTVVATPEPVTA